MWNKLAKPETLGGNPRDCPYRKGKIMRNIFRKSLSWADRNIKYIFSLPAILLTLVMILYPIGYSIYMSFCEWNMSVKTAPNWVGVKNYLGIFQDKNFLDALSFTIRFAIYTVAIEIVAGTALALFASKLKKGGTFVKTACILPMVTTPIVIGMLWKMMMDPAIGVFNTILKMLGLPTSLWLTSPDTVIGSLVMISAWFGIPMVVLIVLSGISSVPEDCYDAAYVDGATSWQVTTKITLPLLKPTITVALILKLIDSLKAFDIIYSSTQGGPQNTSINLNYLIYKNLFEYFKIGKASAALIVFLLLVFGLTLLMLWVKKRNEVDG